MLSCVVYGVPNTLTVTNISIHNAMDSNKIPRISELQRLQLDVSGKQNIRNRICLERLQTSLAYRQISQILREV